MGAAVYMGMSLSDFFILTPKEFFGIWQYCNEKQMQDIYGQWDMVRTHACITLQPNLRKGSHLTPEKLIPLPAIDHPRQRKHVKMSAEEARARFLLRKQQLESFKSKKNI